MWKRWRGTVARPGKRRRGSEVGENRQRHKGVGKGAGGGWRRVDGGWQKKGHKTKIFKKKLEEASTVKCDFTPRAKGQDLPQSSAQCSPADSVTVPELPFKGANKEPFREPPVIFSLVLCRLEAPEAMGHSHENLLIYSLRPHEGLLSWDDRLIGALRQSTPEFIGSTHTGAFESCAWVMTGESHPPLAKLNPKEEKLPA